MKHKSERRQKLNDHEIFLRADLPPHILEKAVYGRVYTYMHSNRAWQSHTFKMCMRSNLMPIVKWYQSKPLTSYVY